MKLNKVYQGNSEKVLKTFPDNYFDTCITSPPYYNLRDYGTASWDGGDPNCSHYRESKNANPDFEIQSRADVELGTGDAIYKDVCAKCGAIRIDEQIGLEKTSQKYVDRLVLLFREVRRVLKPSGTLWINLGDSYAGSSKGNNPDGTAHPSKFSAKNGTNKGTTTGLQLPNKASAEGLKPKDMMMIPARVALALQADGWYLRSDIIWHKENPMPESVTDRPTKSHEYIFLLSKSQQYYYDAEAIKEDQVEYERKRRLREKKNGLKTVYNIARDGKTGLADQSASEAVRNVERRQELAEGGKRNKRTVWTVATRPYKEAHFATFPEELITDCIKAGSSEHGCCESCGAPYERVIEKSGQLPGRDRNHGGRTDERSRPAQWEGRENPTTTVHKGWQPTCECNAGIVPAEVLDPFGGSGTTLATAEKLGRRCTVVELNPKYIKIIDKRMHNSFGLFNTGI